MEYGGVSPRSEQGILGVIRYISPFNFSGLADYLRDFAAFANSSGGLIIFGVTDSPRKLVGLTNSALNQFERVDPEKISGFLLETFSPNIDWEQCLFTLRRKKFGIFHIHESKGKPIIAQKNEGRGEIIKNGEIYFRYGGRTQKILFPELNGIIQGRIQQQNEYWRKTVAKMAKIDPRNAAILDTEKGVIEKDEKQVLVIDEELTKKLKFLKEGDFSSKKGATALKLSGDVYPIDSVEVVKIKQKNLLELYPLSFRQMESKIRKHIPQVKQHEIYEAIKENNLKANSDYSVYNFRNKAQEEEYTKSGKLPTSIPSIYNENAVKFLVKVIKDKRKSKN